MRVLLATDGSEYSEGAASFLTRFNFSKKDEIVVLHVISEIPYDDDYHAQIRRVIKRVAPKILKASADILSTAGAEITTVEEEGYPDTAIIEKSIDYESDLIVMGARGVKGVELLFLGSATRAVAINSPRPVLVFKRPSWEASETMKVLFATDGSEIAEEAGRFVGSMPLPSETEIMIMHTAFSFIADIPPKYVEEIGEQITGKPSTYKKSERIFEQAKAHLGDRFTKIDYLLRIGDPSREILALEKALEPDMIIVGCRGLRGIKGMMGSVSRRILGHSESSVLIAKPCAKKDRETKPEPNEGSVSEKR
jgi:nucleotide-binding universal stress UspA family protein